MCRAGAPDPAVIGKPAEASKSESAVAPRATAPANPAAEPAGSGDPALQSVPAEIAAAAPEPTSWPDEAAESAMVSELRARGEAVVPSPPAAESVEETDSRPLPPLNELVQKIPAEVRDALEDLFRARFVTVKRVPKKALK